MDMPLCSALAELGKPLRGLPHGPHQVATTTTSSSTLSMQLTQTGRRRVFIITAIQTQRPTLPYLYQFYPDKTQAAVPLLSRHSQVSSPAFFAIAPEELAYRP